MLSEVSSQSPYGARARSGAVPRTSSIRSLVRPSSLRTRPGGSVVSCGWVQVWLATAWPSSARARSRSGNSRAFSPMTKNVARVSWRRRIRRISGVWAGCGPSSKVRKISRRSVDRRKATSGCGVRRPARSGRSRRPSGGAGTGPGRSPGRRTRQAAAARPRWQVAASDGSGPTAADRSPERRRRRRTGPGRRRAHRPRPRPAGTSAGCAYAYRSPPLTCSHAAFGGTGATPGRAGSVPDRPAPAGRPGSRRRRAPEHRPRCGAGPRASLSRCRAAHSLSAYEPILQAEADDGGPSAGQCAAR